MASWLVRSIQSSCPGPGKALYSLSASLHPGVQMGTDEFNAGGNPAMDWHPIQVGVEIFL